MMNSAIWRLLLLLISLLSGLAIVEAFSPTPIIARRRSMVVMKNDDTAAISSCRRDQLLRHGASLLLSSGLLLASGIKPAMAAEGSISSITDKVYFDIDIGGKEAGRFVFGLYGKDAPVTVSNFMKVLDGTAQGASYDYSTVFRVEKVCVPTYLADFELTCNAVDRIH